MRPRVTRLTTVVALLLLAAPLSAETQSGKVPRIGVLSPVFSPTSESPEGSPLDSALRQGLRELGYVEGQTIAIEWRWARGDAKRYPDFAAEMVRLKVDLIVAANNPAALAAQRATRTIPIVVVLASDPVGLGLVASLARPGGNITGLSIQTADTVGKRLQLLKEAIPKVSRMAVLVDPTFPGGRHQAGEAEVAAQALGVQSQLLETQIPTDLDRAFGAMTQNRAGAVLIVGSKLFFGHRARIAELAVKSRLPAMCVAREYAEAGCLMSYGASFPDLFRRSATYVDKIIKGAKPADLPVEQPTKFELTVNVKTANALGLKIPPLLRLRADHVIE